MITNQVVAGFYYKMHKISSKMTILLENTNSLEITILKIFYLNNLVIFVILIVNAYNIINLTIKLNLECSL